MSSVLRRRLILAVLIMGVLASILLLNLGLQGRPGLGQAAVVLFLGCVGGFAAWTRRSG
ncbi:hypothetical protein [Caulobacter endophyticus]|uniref:hypothetical protein n=1 Tax=Caulobacter endophyticus TaxID=2172652 RepID=UPI00240F86DE|nr:hypothetical protein [Caulobacter endophyticus]MDG2530836.1 hypothetical protein [Caulobacter endophyticus]